jgi:hypothetical protein
MRVFGKPPIDPVIVASKLISFVRDQQQDDRPDWTAAVKSVLGSLANKKDYIVYPSAREREWLLDLTWLHKGSGAIHLAVESEWGNQGCVLNDFQKLLCVKAPLKIMVYYAYRGSFVGQFERYMRQFDQHVKGENYILIEFAPGPEDHIYFYDVPNDGRLQTVRFEPKLQAAAAA